MRGGRVAPAFGVAASLVTFQVLKALLVLPAVDAAPKRPFWRG